ncbi:bifunctional diguanylate cyclase/phosphodiesterase [Accumulibacter sp.]|uniref:putative bifunctional diguanylate cyclase/phosphodiesterase n=1 Tax=Accumulibacter sp. TaxID=2053492 RepID=UPI0025D996A3|nr:EAL domain-containing protein [Accumulibacter sp.]MCM8595846.1 EAL domain-containing protein [Accumulibacter sp.]MCM8626567.1 EAL domain-containing protein [Accumulibacter sp.]MDS4049994.1 EAL domain-containing protein [Accumulibacter sp.]
MSDLELASELCRAALHSPLGFCRQTIGSLFRRALASGEAVVELSGQIRCSGEHWQRAFASATERRGVVGGETIAGGGRCAWLAAPLLGYRGVIGFVGVSGRRGGYDAAAQSRFSALASLLANALSARDKVPRAPAAPPGVAKPSPLRGTQVDRGSAAAHPASWPGGASEVEQTLRLHAAIVECSGEAVLVTDREERIVSINRAFSDMTGYPESEVLGRSPGMLLHRDGQSTLLARIADRMGVAGEWRGELQFTRKDGNPFPARTLIAAVRDAVGRVQNYFFVFSDVSERKEAERQIHQLAYYDALTGLPNRSLLYSLLDKALSIAVRSRTHVAVLFLDLNRFKHIVDSFGHTQADLILKEVSRRLSATLRAEDIVARLGGDEFVIALPDIGRREHAGQVARKLLAVLAEAYFLETQEILLSGSIGISIFPEDGRDTEALLKNADVAMYRAKGRGSSALVYYSQEMNQRSLEQLKIEGALRRASERGEFHLVYQPQLDLGSGRIVGAEALLRWNHPEHGPISPAQFIPVAEETGLIQPIGEWVIDAACRQIREWLDLGLSKVRVAVNLSARQFSASLPKRVVTIIARQAIPHDSLELEITESMLMHSADSVVAMMREFGEAGLLMTLDDFGTGYSSLSYLKRFPITNLKIDRSFVRGIPCDRNDSAIARAIISMARSLRMSVIAEGVETAAQMEFLRGAGCEEIQGFYFSRPLPPNEFAELLLRTNL